MLFEQKYPENYEKSEYNKFFFVTAFDTCTLTIIVYTTPTVCLSAKGTQVYIIVKILNL